MNPINVKQIVLWNQEQHGLIKKLQVYGVIPANLECVKCKSQMRLNLTDNDEYWLCNAKVKNRNKKRIPCKYKKTLKAATIFNTSHLSFEQIFIALHEWCNYSEIQKMTLEAGMGSSATAAMWNGFFTEIAINACIYNSEPIGENITILFLNYQKYTIHDYD